MGGSTPIFINDFLNLLTLLHAEFYSCVSDSLSLVLLTMQVHQHQDEQRFVALLDNKIAHDE